MRDPIRSQICHFRTLKVNLLHDTLAVSLLTSFADTRTKLYTWKVNMKLFNQRVVLVLLASTMMTSTSIANQNAGEAIQAADAVAAQMNLTPEAAQRVAIEALSTLDGQTRAQLLKTAEQNVLELRRELMAEEARLEAANQNMVENQTMHTFYAANRFTLWLAFGTAVSSGKLATVIGLTDGYGRIPKTLKRIFWTSAAIIAVSAMTKHYLDKPVKMDREQVEKARTRVSELNRLAEREQQVIEVLKRFYKIDIEVKVAPAK